MRTVVDGTCEILLDSSEGNHIANYQVHGISHFEANQFSDFERDYNVSEVRCEATGRFNCHGMTFAARRTTLDAPEVLQILSEDGYSEVLLKDVMPGDIILYYSDDGDVEHSAIVVGSPTKQDLWIPKVYSKWGKYKELIHWANQCPYAFDKAKYYRIKACPNEAKRVA